MERGEAVKLILQSVEEAQNKNIYDLLEQQGYLRNKAWSTVTRLKRRGLILRTSKGVYRLTGKGQQKLHRLLYGLVQCPFCGSRNTKLNGRRDGTGSQRFYCNDCHFTWTEGYELEAVVRALRRKGRTIFILHTSERFAYPILQKLKLLMKGEEVSLEHLAKDVSLIIP